MALNDLAPLGQLFPQVYDRIDVDKTADGILSIRGVPARWTRNDDEMARLRAERMKHDQAQLDMEKMAAVSEAMGKAAPAVKVLADKGKATAA